MDLNILLDFDIVAARGIHFSQKHTSSCKEKTYIQEVKGFDIFCL